jgi:serine/threonine-protein kinase
VRLRFHREVEILRQIDSPWVVKVRSEGLLPDGRPWYAMEFIDGQSLARILSTARRSDPTRVVAWLRGACRGLAAIHDAGFVHRDVKPANLIVVKGGGDDVRIVDLGIAERIHAQPEQLSGTPEYIAPEQAEFRPVDVRSDVYALGCCAYELLTGRRLVEGRSAVAKINAHIEGVRPCWPRYAGIPMALRRLVERCLARQPEARPPNMHALQADLLRVEQTLTYHSGRFPPLRPLVSRTITELDLSARDGVIAPPRRRPWNSLTRMLRAALRSASLHPRAETPTGLLTLRARVRAG